jgi:DNA-binding IclR family transcriptional regulator
MDMEEAIAAAVPGAQSIRRAITVLRILAAAQESGVRASQVAVECQLNRSTVHRILAVLVQEGLAEQHPRTRRYTVGREVTLLGLARSSMFPIRATAERFLRNISERCGDSVFLTIRAGLDSICVDRRTGSYPIQVLSVAIGARRPLGVGVGGLVLLASLPDKEVSTILRENAKRLAIHRLPRERLVERVERARAMGYAYTDAGVAPGTRAVAVGVRDAKGRCVAAISISTVSARLSAARARDLVMLMREQSTLLSSHLRR